MFSDRKSVKDSGFSILSQEGGAGIWRPRRAIFSHINDHLWLRYGQGGMGFKESVKIAENLFEIFLKFEESVLYTTSPSKTLKHRLQYTLYEF